MVFRYLIALALLVFAGSLIWGFKRRTRQVETIDFPAPVVAAATRDAVELTVTAQKTVKIEGQEFDLAQMPRELQRLRQRGVKAVSILNQSGARFGDTVQVLDQVRLAGFEQVNVVTGEGKPN